MKAIALSLQESGLSSSDMANANANETAKGEKQAQDDSGKIKRKKPVGLLRVLIYLLGCVWLVDLIKSSKFVWPSKLI